MELYHVLHTLRGLQVAQVTVLLQPDPPPAEIRWCRLHPSEELLVGADRVRVRHDLALLAQHQTENSMAKKPKASQAAPTEAPPPVAASAPLDPPTDPPAPPVAVAVPPAAVEPPKKGKGKKSAPKVETPAPAVESAAPAAAEKVAKKPREPKRKPDEERERFSCKWRPYDHHPTKLDRSTKGFIPDTSTKRPLEEISKIVAEIDTKMFKGKLGALTLVYEGVRSYKVGTTRAHILTQYHPDTKTIGIREYCGLPAFPDEILRVSLYHSMLSAYLHKGSPNHGLFDEADKDRKAKFFQWFNDCANRTNELTGPESLERFEQFRRDFVSWTLKHLKPEPEKKAVKKAAETAPVAVSSE